MSLSLEGRGGAEGAHPASEPPHEARGEGGGGASPSLWLLEEMDVRSPAFLSLHRRHCTDSPLLNM